MQTLANRSSAEAADSPPSHTAAAHLQTLLSMTHTCHLTAVALHAMNSRMPTADSGAGLTAESSHAATPTADSAVLTHRAGDSEQVCATQAGVLLAPRGAPFENRPLDSQALPHLVRGALRLQWQFKAGSLPFHPAEQPSGDSPVPAPCLNTCSKHVLSCAL